MTVVCRERNWKLELLGNEHGIPHIHLRWPDGRASIAIETGEVLVGKPPSEMRRDAVSWVERHHTELLTEWFRLNPIKGTN